jgi:hypothetical protein
MRIALIVDTLEPRTLLAWGAYPHLIGQDRAAADFPNVTGAGAIIVDIDSGVNLAHPNLSGHLWKNPGEVAGDGIDNDGDGYVDDVNGYDLVRDDGTPDDEAGHGTATAGIMVASPFTFNGASYAGLAQGAKIVALKVLDQTGAWWPGDEARIEKALQWVEAMNRRFPIAAVNMSFRTLPDGYLSTYADEIQRLADAGVILSASGGQDDVNADVHYPSLDPNVWATSVVDEQGHVSSIVNRGPNLDLLAPGNRVPIPVRSGTGFVASGEGSSMSAPHVTALAVLVKQVWPEATASQVLAVLKDSGTPVKDTSTGLTYSGGTYARIDVDAAIRLAYRRGGHAPPPAAQMPYNGAPFAAGGKIEAEDFDLGGEGLSYHDTTAGNADGDYRDTDVDLVESAAAGGTIVDYAVKGEWLEYAVNVSAAEAGKYVVALRYASPVDGARVHFDVDGVAATGSISLARTGAWTTYAVATTTTLSLTAGTHVLRLAMDANNSWGYAGNFDWISLTKQQATPPPPDDPPPPTSAGPVLSASADVGGARPAGATSVITAGRDYDVMGGGNDIWMGGDQFRFAYATLAGDFDLRVQLAGLTQTNAWAKAGLMARASLAGNAANALSLATPGANGAAFSYRATTGGTSVKTAAGGAVVYPNVWLRLRRVGNTFVGYRSSDGVSWVQTGSATIAGMPATMYVGLAVTSHNTSALATAKFRQFGAR